MKIFIDNEFKCYTSNDGTRREYEVDFFDNKCEEFINGYLYVPYGEVLTQKNGQTFRGEFYSPWKEYTQLELAQSTADRIQEENDVLYSALIEIIYQDSVK